MIAFAAFLDADVSVHAALRPSLMVVAGAALLTAGATRLLGWTRGPALATCLILVARSGDAFHILIGLLLVALAGVTWVFARRILPSAGVLQNPNRLANAVTLVLIASTVLAAAVSGTLGRINVQQGQSFAVASPANGLEQARNPDIYVVLLDGYPREDTLGRLFGFDNTDFLLQLRDRGFEVAEASRSNYMYTAMSLTSVLHMA